MYVANPWVYFYFIFLKPWLLDFFILLAVAFCSVLEMGVNLLYLQKQEMEWVSLI